MEQPADLDIRSRLLLFSLTTTDIRHSAAKVRKPEEQQKWNN